MNAHNFKIGNTHRTFLAVTVQHTHTDKNTHRKTHTHKTLHTLHAHRCMRTHMAQKRNKNFFSPSAHAKHRTKTADAEFHPPKPLLMSESEKSRSFFAVRWPQQTNDKTKLTCFSGQEHCFARFCLVALVLKHAQVQKTSMFLCCKNAISFFCNCNCCFSFPVVSIVHACFLHPTLPILGQVIIASANAN